MGLKNRILRFSDVHYIILAACLAGSLFICFKVIAANNELGEQLGSVNEKYLDTLCLKKGDWAPAFYAVSPDGEEHYFRPGQDGPKLLQIVSLKCAASGMQTKEWWPQLASDHRLAPAQPVLVAIEQDGGMEALRDIYGPVFYASVPTFKRDYRVSQAPILALVGKSGRVKWLHRGVLNEALYMELVQITKTMVANSTVPDTLRRGNL